jgi:hypothetical protein
MLWLLDNGLWLDNGKWDDSDFWQDYPEAVILPLQPPPSRKDYTWFDRGRRVKKVWR